MRVLFVVLAVGCGRIDFEQVSGDASGLRDGVHDRADARIRSRASARSRASSATSRPSISAQWCEWAFSQAPPGEQSELSQLIRILETPSRPSGKVPQSFDRGTPAKPPAGPVKVEALPSAIPVAPSSRSGTLLTLLVLLLLAGGAYALYYFDLWADVLRPL